MVSVTVGPDRGWFNDTEYLAIDFIHADASDIAEYLVVYEDDVTIEDTTTINFRVKAGSTALTGEYYVKIENKSFGETLISDSGDGTITVALNLVSSKRKYCD